MFDLVHKHKRIVQIILALLVVPFAIWGVESYTRVRGSGDSVATVNGIEISQREFALELQKQQEQLRRMFGGSIDPSVLDSPESRRAVLDSMVAQRVLASEAAKAHLFMSRDAVIEIIMQAPEFQEDGKFSAAK